MGKIVRLIKSDLKEGREEEKSCNHILIKKNLIKKKNTLRGREDPH